MLIEKNFPTLIENLAAYQKEETSTFLSQKESHSASILYKQNLTLDEDIEDIFDLDCKVKQIDYSDVPGVLGNTCSLRPSIGCTVSCGCTHTCVACR